MALPPAHQRRAAKKPAARAHRSHREKSDARIVILGVLVLVAALAGAAATFLTGVWTAQVGENIEILAAACTPEGATLYLRNIGTKNISSTGIATTKRVLAGIAPERLSVLPSFSVLPPRGTGMIVDPDCAQTYHPGATCEYTLRAGGNTVKTQVTC